MNYGLLYTHIMDATLNEIILLETNPDHIINIFRNFENNNPSQTTQLEYLYETVRNPCMINHFGKIFELFVFERKFDVHKVLFSFLNGWDDFWTVSKLDRIRHYATSDITNTLRPSIYRLLQQIKYEGINQPYYDILLCDFDIKMEGMG